MGQSIVEIKTFGEALRNTGYKSIESAVAEIIDNSIEAEAKDTFIILSENINPEAKRKVKCIHEIAFLDDGIGMNTEILGKCLGYGIGTRYERKGMGRFGVGLPQASMYACPFVEVYSWQNGIDNCKKVYLDIRKVTDGTQTEIEEPILCEIPQKYKKYINYKCEERIYNFEEHGTLVLWKDCDRIVPKTIPYLKPQLEFSLGQKFRYFLAKGEQTIRLVNLNIDDNSIDIKPNDPMFLMENNCVLGNPCNPGSIDQNTEGDLEPLFEPYSFDDNNTGIVEVPVVYWDRKNEEKRESTVTIRFSKVKSKFYDLNAFPTGNPGGSNMGKYVNRLQGISIVRANREIDFGKFDYYDNQNRPTHRWWGCEIIFGTELDEAFGVANNKQYVELKKIDPSDYFDEEVSPMWLQLHDIVTKTISSIVKDNQKMQNNARKKNTSNSPAEKTVTEAEGEEGDDQDSATARQRENYNTEETNNAIRRTLENTGTENPTDEDIQVFKNSKVKIFYEDRGRSPFFDYDFKLGVACIYINIDHVFYQNFLSKIINDVMTKTIFELFIASFVKAVDKSEIAYKEAYDRLMTDWEAKLKKYIELQLAPENQ